MVTVVSWGQGVDLNVGTSSELAAMPWRSFDGCGSLWVQMAPVFTLTGLGLAARLDERALKGALRRHDTDLRPY